MVVFIEKNFKLVNGKVIENSILYFIYYDIYYL